MAFDMTGVKVVVLGEPEEDIFNEDGNPCPDCGEEMEEDDDGCFCPYCGYED